mmetsp:Transcript_7826/g.19323  ORF Transcript_7826/g.19323 Transcript_7826/m.19323 type:complete len:427 (+) Transcript_7826:2243-3523(+)
MSTPGHTPTCVSWCLCHGHDPRSPGTWKREVCDWQEEGQKVALCFVGALLVNGGIPRCDLAQCFLGSSPGAMQQALQKSLAKIAELPAEVELFPSNTSGTLLFRGGAKLRQSLRTSVGSQRTANAGFRLAARGSADFWDYLEWASETPVPQIHFEACLQLNRCAWEDRVVLLGDSPALAPLRTAPGARTAPMLDPGEFVAAMKLSRTSGEALVLDCRPAESCGSPRIQGSLWMPLNWRSQVPDFWGIWLRSLCSLDTAVLVVCDRSQVAEALCRLQRVAVTDIVGVFLPEDWRQLDQSGCLGAAIAAVGESGSSESFAAFLEAPASLVDVRTSEEFESPAVGRLQGSTHCPLVDLVLFGKYEQFRNDLQHLVVCNDGFRSAAAASVLANHGLQVAWLAGGLQSLRDSGFPLAFGADDESEILRSPF